MSLTVSQYRQTGSDSLLMESRQVSSVLCLAKREMRLLRLLPPLKHIDHTHKGCSFGDILMMSFYL